MQAAQTSMQPKEDNFLRALATVYYYLGIIDGMICYNNGLKSLNPTPMPDFITPWHDLLPPEIHALRHPHADIQAAGHKLAQLFTTADMAKRLQHMTDEEMRVKSDRSMRSRSLVAA
jgi:hypothetical protein